MHAPTLYFVHETTPGVSAVDYSRSPQKKGRSKDPTIRSSVGGLGLVGVSMRGTHDGNLRPRLK